MRTNVTSFNRILYFPIFLALTLLFSAKAYAQAPSITGEPADVAVCAAGNAVFTITAKDANAYQWEESTNGGSTWSNIANGGVYSGATTTSLTLTAVTTGMNNYQYRCVATGTSTPNATSKAAKLIVNPPPVVKAHPATTTICPGADATFSTTAEGISLTYQWQVSTNGGAMFTNLTNGGIYSDVTTATLKLTAPGNIHGYQYRCQVSSCGATTVNTNAAILFFNTIPAVTSDPVAKTVCPTDNTTFTCTATGTGLTYQWQYSPDAGTSWHNVANGGVYSNATTSTLNITNITYSMNDNLYRCKVSGTCNPAVTTGDALLTVREVPEVLSSPDDFTFCATGDATFTCAGDGTGVAYQWQESTDGGTNWANVNNNAIYSGTTTTTLTLTGIPGTMNGNQYRCMISGTCAPPVTTDAAKLILGAVATITDHPDNITACAGTGYVSTMSITATGYDLTYRWEVSSNGGGTWNTVNNGGPYSGATTNTLTFTNPAGLHGYIYRSVAINGCAIETTSNTATLYVTQPPVIVTQPVDATPCLNSNFSYSVSATAAVPITYQWQGSYDGVNWTNLTNGSVHSNVTTNTLDITDAAEYKTYKFYRCVLNTDCKPATMSDVVNLKIYTKPDIHIQPSDKVICLDGNTNFQVGSKGDVLTFQWQMSTDGGTNWANMSDAGIYSGTSTFHLSVAGVSASNDGELYRCIVNGACAPADTSDVAKLTVKIPTAITSNPASGGTICNGGSTSFTVTATGSDLTYKWYENVGGGSGGFSLVTDGGAYSGATTNTLTINGLSIPNNIHLVTYYCEVTGACNTKKTPASLLHVKGVPTIDIQPLNVVRCDQATNVKFSVAASGTNISYQWQENTGSGWNNLSNSGIYSDVDKHTLMISAVNVAMDGYLYRCIITGDCTPSVTSNEVKLTVNKLEVPQVTIAEDKNDICEGESVTFTPTPVNGGSPTYIWKKNYVQVATGSTYTTSTLAPLDVISCQMTSSIACPLPKVVNSNAILMNVTKKSPASVTITSDVGNSNCSGQPVEFTATPVNGGTTPAYSWYINGSPVGSGSNKLSSSMLFNGDEIVCEMMSSMKCPNPETAVSNKIKMTIIPTTRSSIVINPNPGDIVCDKEQVTISAAFTNAGSSPKFQWVLNGIDMPGETQATLKTNTLVTGDIVNCRLISSATCVFPELSNNITFTVNPLLSASVDLNIMYDGSGSSYTFTATPTNGGSNPTYVWYRNNMVQAGVTGNTHNITNLTASDKIYVEMLSSEECLAPGSERVNSRVVTTGIGELEDAVSGIKIYPNPNAGQFTISGQLRKSLAGKDVKVSIVNAVGQQVYLQSYKAGNSAVNLPVRLDDAMANGVYTVNITVENETSHVRFVLSR